MRDGLDGRGTAGSLGVDIVEGRLEVVGEAAGDDAPDTSATDTHGEILVGVKNWGMTLRSRKEVGGMSKECLLCTIREGRAW